MDKKIRPYDLLLGGSAFVPVVLKLPATVISTDPWYLDMVSKVPDWLFWLSLGFAISLWLFDPWRKQSRLREIWHFMTDFFEVESAVICNGIATDDNPMAHDTDLVAQVKIRFRKNGQFKLRLRVFEITGVERTPRERVIRLWEVDAVAGETQIIPIVQLGRPQEGWDPDKARGWGPTNEAEIVRGAGNVVALECEGKWHTQKRKFYVAVVMAGPSNDRPASLQILDEDQDIWDLSENSRIYRGAYGY